MATFGGVCFLNFFYSGTRSTSSDTPKMPISGVLGVSEMALQGPFDRKSSPRQSRCLEARSAWVEEGFKFEGKIFLPGKSLVAASSLSKHFRHFGHRGQKSPNMVINWVLLVGLP